MEGFQQSVAYVCWESIWKFIYIFMFTKMNLASQGLLCIDNTLKSKVNLHKQEAMDIFQINVQEVPVLRKFLFKVDQLVYYMN